MEYKDLVYKRRSVRAYTGGKIPAEEIRDVLECGLMAPNACNFQSWHFYCICDPEKIQGLHPEIYAREWICDASFVVVITVDLTRLEEKFDRERAYMYAVEDAGAGAENMLLRASDLGYGGCFIAAFNQKKCAEYLKIPQTELPVVMLSIGTYGADPEPRGRKPFEEKVTFIGSPEETGTAGK